MKVLAKISLVLIAAFALALCSCSMNIPDGQGLLVVDTESDAVYLKSVYAKKSGASSYSRVWNEKHGLEEPRHIRACGTKNTGLSPTTETFTWTPESTRFTP